MELNCTMTYLEHCGVENDGEDLIVHSDSNNLIAIGHHYLLWRW